MLNSSFLFKYIIRVFVAALLPFLLIELFRQRLYSVMEVSSYLVFHNIAEFFSIVVSFSIFGIGWYAYEQSKNCHSLFLGAIFFGIGLLDLMHTFGYSGMPDFITPNSALKSTQYWTAARLYMAITFLASAYVYPNCRCVYLTKNGLLTLNLAIPIAVFSSVTFFPQYLPITIEEGIGLTEFKKNCEYFIIFLLCLSMAAYWQRMLKTKNQQLIYLADSTSKCNSFLMIDGRSTVIVPSPSIRPKMDKQ